MTRVLKLDSIGLKQFPDTQSRRQPSPHHHGDRSHPAAARLRLSLSRDRTFQTLTDSILYRTVTGHYRTLYRTVPDMIGQYHARVCPKCPVQTGHQPDMAGHVSDISDTIRTYISPTLMMLLQQYCNHTAVQHSADPEHTPGQPAPTRREVLPRSHLPATLSHISAVGYIERH